MIPTPNTFETKIRKVDKSLAIAVPEEIVEKMKIKKGQNVIIILEKI